MVVEMEAVDAVIEVVDNIKLVNSEDKNMSEEFGKKR